MAILGGRRRVLLGAAATIFFLIVVHVLSVPRSNIRAAIDRVPIPGRPKKFVDESPESFALQYEPIDEHPISKSIADADKRWRQYEDGRSLTFKETVSKYRRNHGRHPPPRFKDWYRYAKERNVHNIDDFDQIMDDLRPFWGVPPKVLRTLAAHMWEKSNDNIAGIHIRGGKIVANNNASWRSETLVTLIEKFANHLPDMDIAMNRLDQPRVVVPWEDLQELLLEEAKTRQTMPEAFDGFSSNMTGFLDWRIEKEKDNSTREDPGWFDAPGKQYMDIARAACPPESHAVTNGDPAASEAAWKSPVGGIVTNFNLSSDLCTIGPEIQDKHGFLFTASSIKATKRLVPVFGECKVNVNNDILFPANMYWKHDERYDYNDAHDARWEDKEEIMIWRGVTSGGVQLADNWRRMHRQRLVQMMNATVMDDQEVEILVEKAESRGEYDSFGQYKPSGLLKNHTDVGFTEAWGCSSDDCNLIYGDVLSFRPQMALGEQFKYKYLIDVDGHSFSGRWRAFLESRALGIKATIFREWHDSRLFAWRHFVPLDNRYTEIYTLLTYFLGVGSREDRGPGIAYVSRHDSEAKRLALHAREWANKVLRREDIEVSFTPFPLRTFKFESYDSARSTCFVYSSNMAGSSMTTEIILDIRAMGVNSTRKTERVETIANVVSFSYCTMITGMGGVRVGKPDM